MWALGCVALELLTGRDWFEEYWLQHYHNSDGKVDRLRRKLGPATAAAARLLAERGVSDEGVSFLLACLNPDAETRPDASAISTHAWFSTSSINDRHPSRRPHRRRRSPCARPRNNTSSRRRRRRRSRSRRRRSRSASSSPCCPRRRGRPAAELVPPPPVPPPPCASTVPQISLTWAEQRPSPALRPGDVLRVSYSHDRGACGFSL